MAIAALGGGFAGLAVLFRMYGNRFLGVFSKKRRLKAEIAQGELLGVEIDPETGRAVEPATQGGSASAGGQSPVGDQR
jgi:hypothetical protein